MAEDYVPEWHSTKDEMPTKAGQYLTLRKSLYRDENGAHYFVEVYRYARKKFWWYDPEDGEYHFQPVDYWMEIPPMPKDGDNDAHERTRETDMQEI